MKDATNDRALGAPIPRAPGADHVRLLLETVRDCAIFVLDPEGRVETWGAGAQAMTGYTADEMRGEPIDGLFDDEDRRIGSARRLLESAAAFGHAESEGWRVRKDGKAIWVEETISALRDGAGRLVGFGGIARDRTQRRKREELLRGSEERFRLLVDGIKDYAIFLLDTEGRVQTWNQGARLLKGYTEEEIVGHSIARFYTPEDAAAGRPFRLLGQAVEHGRVEDEGWRVRKDGTRFWADVVITALRDPNGDLVGFAKVTRDLSERRVQEERMRASEERFRLLVQSVKEYAIFMLDTEGRVTTWNEGAERINGYTEREILGSHVSRFYTPEDAASGKAALEMETATRDGVFEEEGWRVRKDGTRFWANVVLTAVRDAHGRLIGFAKVTRDLTERRKFEEEQLRLAQAEEAVRLRDEFLSIASHELRTPLTALQLQLEDLRARFGGGSERLAQRIDRATRSGERLVQLTDALLDVSRISTGRLDLQREPCELGGAVRDVVERLANAAASARCEVRVDGDGELVGFWDRLRIEQVVMNLLSNALKFGAGAPIDLRLSREGGFAVLRVCDQGPGIPAADLQRIFGRFERAASLRHFGGFGLGLYVTQQIVVAHGGSVEASNRPEGGACLSVRLPLAAAGGSLEREAG